MKLRATTKIRNHKLLEAREKLGLNQTDAAELCGVPKTTFMKLEKLEFPKRFNDEMVCKISAALNINTDDIMVPDMAGLEVQNTSIKVKEVPCDRILEYKTKQTERLLMMPEDSIEKQDEIELIKKYMEHLTYREREVIKLRYGIGEEMAYSLEEIARIFKVGRERVSQIEMKALRKIRMTHEKQKGFGINKVTKEDVENLSRDMGMSLFTDGKYHLVRSVK